MKSILGIVTVVAALGMNACETTPPKQEAAIWNKPPRYGHGGTQADDEANAATDDQKKNRFGFGGDDAAAPGDGTAGTAGTGNAGDGSTTAGNTTAGGTNGNLGSTPGTNDTTAGTGSSQSGTSDSKKDDQKKTGEDSKSSPPSQLKSYPFGKPVPGKGGFVTLPAPHDGLGEVDVRGIAPGTPVEIPDPTKPGKKIYFRVP